MSWVGWESNPAPFNGTERERKKNFNSHFWGKEQTFEVYGHTFKHKTCSVCGVKSNSTLSEWLCGTADSVPRLTDKDFLKACKEVNQKRKKSLFRKKR